MNSGEGTEAAAAKFVEVAAAYEIIGSPDNRAVFDDFGTTDMGNLDTAGYESYHEYMASGKQATKDFYSGEDYVTTFDSMALWEKRGVSKGSASADSLWMIEFYAPWCNHCMKSVPLYKRAAELLDGQVNCLQACAVQMG